MDDYIKREAVFQIISDAPRLYLNDVIRADTIRQAVKKLPAADVRENVRGEWKNIGGDEWCCVFCGYIISTEGSWEHPLEVGKCFCSNCGADMRKEENYE